MLPVAEEEEAAAVEAGVASGLAVAQASTAAATSSSLEAARKSEESASSSSSSGRDPHTSCLHKLANSSSSLRRQPASIVDAECSWANAKASANWASPTLRTIAASVRRVGSASPKKVQAWYTSTRAPRGASHISRCSPPYRASTTTRITSRVKQGAPREVGLEPTALEAQASEARERKYDERASSSAACTATGAAGASGSRSKSVGVTPPAAVVSGSAASSVEPEGREGMEGSATGAAAGASSGSAQSGTSAPRSLRRTNSKWGRQSVRMSRRTLAAPDTGAPSTSAPSDRKTSSPV
mmetsp:Transcript_3572/g.11479  ORF Transcript_3572/g.11479 Transcript_3572/m.11479 type:complete len:298 (+) Transcript_3572:2937-3830(+)